jgi:hypothetical protein
MGADVKKRRFTVDEYHQMAQAGVLSEDDRVELIVGEVVEMAPIGSYHAACVKRVNRLLSSRLGDQAILSIQDPIRLDNQSEPQPDVALLSPRTDYYASTHPGPEDVLLLIEVGQGAVGYTQYALGIPAALVAAHILGAAVLWATAVAVWMRARPRMATSVPEPTLDDAQVARSTASSASP